MECNCLLYLSFLLTTIYRYNYWTVWLNFLTKRLTKSHIHKNSYVSFDFFKTSDFIMTLPFPGSTRLLSKSMKYSNRFKLCLHKLHLYFLIYNLTDLRNRNTFLNILHILFTCWNINQNIIQIYHEMCYFTTIWSTSITFIIEFTINSILLWKRMILFFLIVVILLFDKTISKLNMLFI